MRWLELSAEVDREAVEAVAAIFRQEGHSGVIVEEPILPTSEWGGWDSDPTQPVTVRTYLPVGDDTAERRRRVEESLWHLSRMRPISAVTARELDEVDWAEAWKQHYDVHRVGRRTVIKPTWREYQPETNDIVVELDPGMAFGTGLHPTTRLCLAGLETAIEPGDRVIDIGTGSGILAIAATRLGAAEVLAIDNDPVAVAAAESNSAVNGVAIDCRLATSDDVEGSFDLALANISAGVIQAIAGDLARLIRPGGRLLASGFLDTTELQVALVLASAGFSIRASTSDSDWRLLLAHRDAP